MKIEEALKNISLGDYFTAYEFCNKQDGFAIMVPDISLFRKLDNLRHIVGEITLTSGYRTPSFNKSVGGSSNSNHVKGLAVDVKFNFAPWTKENLKKLLSGLGFSNIGIYEYSDGGFGWIHLDTGKPWGEGNGWFNFNGSSIKIYDIGKNDNATDHIEEQKTYTQNGLFIEEVAPSQFYGYATKDGTIPDGKCINASFVWWQDLAKTKPYPLTPLVAGGVHISDAMDSKFNGRMPLFVVYKNGRVGVEVGDTKGRNNILLAVGGIGLEPLNFTGFKNIDGLKYKCEGRIAIGWNEKTNRVVLIGTKEKLTLNEFRAKIKPLGFKHLLGLDSSDSAIWRFTDSERLTLRNMYLFLRW